jgi:hypothetical protein
LAGRKKKRGSYLEFREGPSAGQILKLRFEIEVVAQ